MASGLALTIAIAATALGVAGAAEPKQSGPTCAGETATIIAEPGVVTMGTPEDDVIVGTSGDDVIESGDGNDLICGRGGNDRVDAGAGADRVLAGGGNDVVQGGAGRDVIHAGPGRDRAFGGTGRDRIDGGVGADRCVGGPGADRSTTCERLASPNRRPVVHAIGDSVMLGATDTYCGALSNAVPRINEDAAVSRHFTVGIDLVAAARAGTRGEMIFVVGLGTNGPFGTADFDALVAAAGRTGRLVFVNTRVPRDWETQVNQTIADGVARHAGRAVLVDWNALASADPSLTSGDDIHLTCDGAAAYAAAVAAGVRHWS